MSPVIQIPKPPRNNTVNMGYIQQSFYTQLYILWNEIFTIYILNVYFHLMQIFSMSSKNFLSHDF